MSGIARRTGNTSELWGSDRLQRRTPYCGLAPSQDDVGTRPPGLVRRLPQLYLAACQNASEATCLDDFAVVPSALSALGLPSSSGALGGLLERAHAALAHGHCTTGACLFLRLLQQLDRLPIFGMQGHGASMNMAALPAMLPYWRRATSWCVSNCEWASHSQPVLLHLGLGPLYLEVAQDSAFAAAVAAFVPPIMQHSGAADAPRVAGWHPLGGRSVQLCGKGVSTVDLDRVLHGLGGQVWRPHPQARSPSIMRSPKAAGPPQSVASTGSSQPTRSLEVRKGVVDPPSPGSPQ